MKFRTTLLLVVLNILVFFFLLRQESPFDLKSRIGKDDLGLLPLPMVEATEIEVQGDALDTAYRLIQVDDEWRLEDPVEWAANPFAVRRMISRLESANINVRFPVDDIESRNQSLEDFGLADPNLKLTIRYGDSAYVFAFGAPVEIGDRLYALTPDRSEIMVVEASLLQPFLLDVESLRSSQLFAIPEFEIQSLLVEFNDESSRQRYTRRSGSWIIDSPVVARANPEKMQAAIDRLLNMDIQIVGESVGDQGEVTHFNAFARLEVIGNRRSATLLVSQYMINGEINPDFYRGRIEGNRSVFLIPRGEIDWWRTADTLVRERLILDFNLENVSKFEIQDHGESPFTLRILRLENREWRMYAGSESVSGVNYNVDPGRIVETLGLLKDLRVSEFVADEPTDAMLEEFGLAHPSTVFVLEAGEAAYRIKVGVTTDDGLFTYIQLENSPSVYQVASEVLARLDVDPLYFRNRRVELMDRNIDSLYFRIEDNVGEQVIHNPDLETLIESSRQSISEEDALALQASLRVLFREFSVNRFLSDTYHPEGVEFEGRRVPWRYHLKAYAGPETDQPLFEMWLTERLAGTVQLAYLPSISAVVSLNQDLIDVLHPLLFDLEIPEEYRPPPAGPPPEETEEESEASTTEEAIPEESAETNPGREAADADSESAGDIEADSGSTEIE